MAPIPPDDAESKRRASFSLPTELTENLEAVAAAESTSVNTVVVDLLRRGLRLKPDPKRAASQHQAWIAALSGLTPEEQLLIDGFDLQPE